MHDIGPVTVVLEVYDGALGCIRGTATMEENPNTSRNSKASVGNSLTLVERYLNIILTIVTILATMTTIVMSLQTCRDARKVADTQRNITSQENKIVSILGARWLRIDLNRPSDKEMVTDRLKAIQGKIIITDKGKPVASGVNVSAFIEGRKLEVIALVRPLQGNTNWVVQPRLAVTSKGHFNGYVQLGPKKLKRPYFQDYKYNVVILAVTKDMFSPGQRFSDMPSAQWSSRLICVTRAW